LRRTESGDPPVAEVIAAVGHAHEVIGEKGVGFPLRIPRRRLVVFEPSLIRTAAGLQ
jgi:hypothetical protein